MSSPTAKTLTKSPPLDCENAFHCLQCSFNDLFTSVSYWTVSSCLKGWTLVAWLAVVNYYLRWPGWADDAREPNQSKVYSYYNAAKLIIVKTSCWLVTIVIADGLSNQTQIKTMDRYSETSCEANSDYVVYYQC